MAALALTGARGYLGACIARELESRGIPFSIVEGDLVGLAPTSVEARCVIHAAGALRHRDPAAIHKGNSLATQRLLAALDPAAAILFISSRSVYAVREADHPASGDGPGESLQANHYGLAKHQAEQHIRESGRSHIILRASTLVGAGAGGAGHSFLTAFAAGLIAGTPPKVAWPDRHIDYFDVRVAARLAVDAATAMGDEKTVYDLAGPHRSLHRLVQHVRRAVECQTGAAPEIAFEEMPMPDYRLLEPVDFESRFGKIAQTADEILCDKLVQSLCGRCES